MPFTALNGKLPSRVFANGLLKDSEHSLSLVLVADEFDLVTTWINIRQWIISAVSIQFQLSGSSIMLIE